MKIYKKIFLSFLTICLLPFFMSCINLFHLEEALRESIIQDESSFMEQIGNVIDEEIRSARQSGTYFQQNNQIHSLAEKQVLNLDDRFTVNELRDSLASLRLQQALCEENFVYFYASGNLVSSYRNYSKDFIKNFTTKYQISYPHFMQMLKDRTFEYTQTIDGSSSSYLLVMTPIYSYDEYRTVGCFGSFLSVENYLNGIMTDGEIYLQNGNGDLILGSDVAAYAVGNHVDEDFFDFQGEAYYTLNNTSDSSDITYGSLAPRKVYFQSINMMRTQLVIQLIGYTGIMLLLIFFFTREMYSPIKRVIRVFERHKKMTYDIQTFAQLEKSLIEMADNQTILEGRINSHSEKYEAEHLLNENLYGWSYDFSILEKIIPDGSPYRLAVFRPLDIEKSILFEGVTDTKRNQSYPLLLFAVENVLEEIFLTKRSGVCCQTDGQLVLILSSDDPDALKGDANRAITFFKQALSLKCRCYIGEQYNSFLDLHIAYDLLSKFYRSSGENDTGIFIMKGTQQLPDKSSANSNTQSLTSWGNFAYHAQKISDLVAKKHYAAAAELLQKLLQQLEQTISGSPMFIFYLKELAKLILEKSAPEKLSKILQLDEAEKVEAALKKVVEQMYTLDKEANREASCWAEEVQHYILEHFKDPSLNATAIADYYKVRLSTLSHQYRQAMGQGILDTIHQARISESKKLLAQGMTIRAVAKEVGYTDSRALVRAYKRYEGTLPSEFKE